MRSERRRYRLVDEDTRSAAVATVLTRITSGDSFTSACQAVAKQIDVSDTAVRKWVNDSGKRPQPSWDRVRELESQLATATDLNRRLAARLGGTEL